MKIRDIQKSKPFQMQTISPDKTIHHAIKQLCQYNIGALPVVDAAGALVGIISERDVLRLCSRDDFVDALSLTVSEVMTRDVVIGLCDDDLDYVMHVMTDRRIRHLPIFEEKVLITIVSIGDIVKAQYDQKDNEARFLRDYMAGATA